MEELKNIINKIKIKINENKTIRTSQYIQNRKNIPNKISPSKIVESIGLLILLIADTNKLYFKKEENYKSIINDIIKEKGYSKNKKNNIPEIISNLPKICNVIIKHIKNYKKKKINKMNDDYEEKDTLDTLIHLFIKYQELRLSKIDFYELKKNIYIDLRKDKLIKKINHVENELDINNRITDLIKDIYNHLNDIKNNDKNNNKNNNKNNDNNKNNNESISSFFKKVYKTSLKESVKYIKNTSKSMKLRLFTQKLNKNINKIELNNLKDTIQLLIIVISYNKGIDIKQENVDEILEKINLKPYRLLYKKLPNLIKNIISITKVTSNEKKKIESIQRKFLNQENIYSKYDEYDFLIYIFSYYRDIWLSDEGLNILKYKLINLVEENKEKNIFNNNNIPSKPNPIIGPSKESNKPSPLNKLNKQSANTSSSNKLNTTLKKSNIINSIKASNPNIGLNAFIESRKPKISPKINYQEIINGYTKMQKEFNKYMKEASQNNIENNKI